MEVAGVRSSHRNPKADEWGDITVAQPKIWQFERVSALLDGLLRDVEGVSLGDLTQLDPNQQNAAALKFVQSALEVGVQYDQAAAVNAANTQSSYNELHASQTQQLNQYNNYMQALTSERDRLAAQYSAASNEVNALQALKAAGPLTDGQQKQLDEATSRQASTNASLASVNSLISGAGAAPSLSPPPTLTGTSVQKPASGSDMSSTLMGFSDMLKSLPSGVQNNLSAALNAPSYPATKKLDNFITLLYERLAREVSVLQDDLTRDPENVAFLLQFDVGLYPSKKAKDHVARVEFNLDCPGCKVYSLYPGQSSYNIANYSGSSKRYTFWGNVLTLIGLGVSASYRRQTDALNGSLVQSVYMAGFQNGVLDGDDPRSRAKADANMAEQSFGWYYGAAPFEQLVTPGIRSTFALVTVPRVLIQRSEDKFGNTDACMPFHIDAAWANRTDPLAQDTFSSPLGSVVKQARVPFYQPKRTPLTKVESGPRSGDPPYDASVLTMITNVKLPASLDDYSLIASREKKMHVLRMEYNTVYEPPDPAANATSVQTTIQTSSQSTNQVTGQTSGQTTSQTTGSAVTVGNTPATNGAANVSSASDPLPCLKGQCAPILLKLDRPIDPNLVVTVRGQPLKRVRDWRGRATSVLPAAQSGTDLSVSESAAGSLTSKQLETTRSLLETEQFAPNTWFTVNSHELLLNISEDVATDDGFPVIQLADPSGSVVIPHDLRTSFTELIVDGYRLRPETEQGIQLELARQNWREADVDSRTGLETCPNGAAPLKCIIPAGSKDAPISSGPYAFSTYLPLFSPEPSPRTFFAMVGETGDELLIGFLPRSERQKETDKTTHFDWLGTQTRVILEDRDQDFAWSLSCDVQGDLLACRMPREEISRTYLNLLRACPNNTVCPGLDMEWRSLLQSLPKTGDFKVEQQNKLQDAFRHFVPLVYHDPTRTTPPSGQHPSESEEVSGRVVRTVFGTTSGTPSAHSMPGDGMSRDDGNSPQTKTKTSEQYQTDLLQGKDLEGFRNAFISTMELWIEQTDPEGKNVFYSPEPARIGFLPLSNDYWSDTSFKPWDFKTADADSVTLRECNYLPSPLPPPEQSDLFVSLLGVRTWPDWLTQSQSPPESAEPVTGRPGWARLTSADPSNPVCRTFTAPTATLANDPIVFSMEFPPHRVVEDNPPVRATIVMPRMRLGPSLKRPDIRPFIEITPAAGGKLAVETKAWRILIPVEHSTCADDIELPREIRRSKPKDAKSNPDYNTIDVQWLDGTTELTPCPDRAGADHTCTEFTDWKRADDAGRIYLYLEIPRVAINDLPDQVNVVRTTSDGVKWVVATLPNLRKMLLPSRLAIDPLSPTQFALRGENAGAIDAVAMQSSSDSPARTFRTAPGVDFALVTLPDQSASTKTGTDTSGGANGTTSSTSINIEATKSDAKAVITQSNSSTPPKAAAPGANAPAAKEPPAGNNAPDASSTTPPKSLAPGTYAVLPLIQVGIQPPDQPTLDANAAAANKDSNAADAVSAKAAKAWKDATKDKGASKDSVNTLKAEADKQAANAASKKKAATEAAGKAKAGPTPLYMPLTVTDEKGKPLIFTIPDPKKQSTTPPATTPTVFTTTCATPCVVLPCTASCPPTPAPAAAPKTQ